MHSRAIRKTVRGFFNVSDGRARYKTIRKRILESATIDGIHISQLIAAMIIASIGLNTDSTEAVIGAMLICPLMGSVLALSYSVATADSKLLRTTLIGLLVQGAVCLATSTLYFLASPLSNTTSQLLTNTSATIWDVIIAFVGGFAGALGISRKQEPTTLLAGVAVATALMPPLCASGFGLAQRDFVTCASGIYEFLVNVVFIAFGAHIVLMLLKVPMNADLDGDGMVTPEEELEVRARTHRMRRRVVIGSILFAIPCLFFSSRVVHRAMSENGTVFETIDRFDTELITRELRVVFPQVLSYRIGDEDSYSIKDGVLHNSVVATIESKQALSERDQKNIEALLRLHVEDLDTVTFETVE